jgi:hypothetical protein
MLEVGIRGRSDATPVTAVAVRSSAVIGRPTGRIRQSRAIAALGII